MTETLDSILRAFRVFDGFNGPANDELWWRTDGEYAPVTLMVNCNDLFFWGTADCEVLTADNIDLLESAKGELMGVSRGETPNGRKLDCGHYAALLWCCRVRKMRPQKPYYKHLPEQIHPLFDACADGWVSGQ